MTPQSTWLWLLLMTSTALLQWCEARIVTGTSLTLQGGHTLAKDAAGREFPATKWDTAAAPNGVSWTLEQLHI